MKKVIGIISAMVLIIILLPSKTAKADIYNDIVYEPFDIKLDGETLLWDYTSLGEAYLDLTNSQKEIVQYLIGLYNYMYMGARGFKYNGVNTDTELQARLKAFGNRLIYGDGFFGWRSRVNETFRQYISACIIYASNIQHYDGHEVTFDEWWNNIVQGGHKLYIPYNEDALDAWTDFYNDPSNDGIVSFGEWESQWSSGEYKDFPFEGIGWRGNDQTKYNNFVLNRSPILYGTMNGSIDDATANVYVYGFGNVAPFDSLYILRTPNSEYYSQYRFGYRNSVPGNIEIMSLYVKLGRSYGNLQIEVPFNESTAYMIGTIQNIGVGYTLRNIINLAFNQTPLSNNSGNSYPFINHVYLVDDLNTLSNKEELEPTESLDIDGSRTGWYLETPNGNWYYYDGDPDFDDPDIIENSYKDDGTGQLVPTTGDDFSRQIINNTVINNYFVVQPDQEINVPIDWFSRGNGYIAKLWYYVEPFTMFIADIFNSLGDLRLVLLACLIFGIAGGVIGKFLL